MRVIVTRPERDAQTWVRALAQHGHDAFALPLISIHPVPDTTAIRAAWQHLGDYAAVMFVSGSAVEHFFALKSRSDRDLDATSALKTRAWVTGPGTAAALRRHAVDASRIDAPASASSQFDSEALWAVVGAGVHAGDRVLIVRGGDRAVGQTGSGADSAGPGPGLGRDWFAQHLTQAGAQVEFLLAYWRGAPVWSAKERARAQTAAADGSLWLFTSAQAVANLLACLPHQNWAHARALATHARIAAAARAGGFGVVWESRPSVSDVVASIESIG